MSYRLSSDFCRETHFRWQGPLANGVPSGPGSENVAMNLLPSRDRKGAVSCVSRQKLATIEPRIIALRSGGAEAPRRLKPAPPGLSRKSARLLGWVPWVHHRDTETQRKTQEKASSEIPL